MVNLMISTGELAITCSYSGLDKCKAQIVKMISPIFLDWFNRVVDFDNKTTETGNALCGHYQELFNLSDDFMNFLFENADKSILSKEVVHRMSEVVKDDLTDFSLDYSLGPTYQNFRYIVLEADKNDLEILIEEKT